MQKSVPLDYGHFYHIYNRGNNKEDIFFEERNYRHFLKLYAKYVVPVADTYAYCLLKNHFHFLVQIKQTSEVLKTSEVLLNPTRQFSKLFNSYAKAINKAYHRSGSLFQKRFGRNLIDSDQYFISLITYIHLNPQKHGFVSDFQTYHYSSYQTILHHKQASRLETSQVLKWFGGTEAFAAHHRNWANEKLIMHLIGED